MAKTAIAALLLLAAACGALAEGPTTLRDQFTARCQDYLARSASAEGGGGEFADLSRLGLNVGVVSGDGLRSSFADMAARKDCSDFGVTTMIRMLLQFPNSTLWPAGLREDIRTALLNWQYWISEANGNQGNMEFWTENHQMDFHSSEYLVGILYPDEFFPGTNMTGAEHAAKGRDFVYRWMERRYSWGFQEWKSDTYLQFDVISLVHIATLSPEPALAQRAAMVLDLLLYDITIHSHKGLMASSRGRSYGSNKFNVGSQTVAAVTKILSGGPGNDGLAVGPVVALCLSSLQGKYTVPAAVLGIAADTPEELESFERIGIDPTMPELAAETGLGLSTADDGMVWWGMEAYAHPRTFDLAFVMGDTWDLYHSNETLWHYFDILRPYRNSTHLHDLIVALWPGTTSILGPVFSYLFRTPDVALGGALDYRPGVVGFQQHAWQASLNGTIMVFTTQPGPFTGKPPATPSLSLLLKTLVDVVPRAAHLSSADARTLALDTLAVHMRATTSAGLGGRQDRAHHRANPSDKTSINNNNNNKKKDSNSNNYESTQSNDEAAALGLGDDYADGYWTGSASMPRVGQAKDVLIAIYNPPYDGEPKEIFTPRTHAYFPKKLFDDVVDRLADRGWIAGRAGNAYVALYSNSKNITWQTKSDFADREILAEGAKVVWVCIVGRQKTYGSFANFTNMTVLHASVTVDEKTLATDVRLPGAGQGRRITFGWDSELFVVYDSHGTPRTVPQSTVQRLSSPYASVPFPPRDDVVVSFRDAYVRSNFAQNTRVVHDGAQGAEQGAEVGAEVGAAGGVDGLAALGARMGLEMALDIREDDRIKSAGASSAASAGVRVAQHILSVWNDSSAYPHFQPWGYEGGVIQLGLWELSNLTMVDESDRRAIQHECSRVLDKFQKDHTSLGYKILHNEDIPLPWGYSIGDHAALFPVAFAARLRYGPTPSPADLALVQATAKKYVLGYPHHLDDGTTSRPVAWWPDYFAPNASAVWADDAFMGTAVVAHTLGLQPERQLYADYLVTQATGFAAHLRDSSTGLLHHGYDQALGRQSCCLWGRGNGWALMALTDTLLALSTSSSLSASASVSLPVELLQSYQQLAAAVVKVQAPSGLWHNLLNDSKTLPETSCTAFFTYSLAIGVARGWLSRAVYLPIVQQALVALQGQVAGDGSVEGIIGETGIKAAAQEYEPRSTSFAHAAPGLGAVLRAFVATAALGM